MNKPLSLDRKLKAVGFRLVISEKETTLSSNEQNECDIERTLVNAAFEAMSDGRIRSILFTWFKVHGERVITDKFFRVAKAAEVTRGHNPIINALAVFAVISGHHKFKGYIKKTKSNEYLVSKEVSESFKSVQGFKEDFLEYGVKVPSKMIRIRESDVLTVEELATQNLQYCNRIFIGASWRADIITAIELGAASPTEIKNSIGCSYEPAHRVFREYMLLKNLKLVA